MWVRCAPSAAAVNAYWAGRERVPRDHFEGEEEEKGKRGKINKKNKKRKKDVRGRGCALCQSIL